MVGTSTGTRGAPRAGFARPEAAVRVEDRGTIREVVLDRPSRKNALTIATYRALTAAFSDAATNDQSHRVLILASSGGPFSVGNDFGDLLEGSQGASDGEWEFGEHRGAVPPYAGILSEAHRGRWALPPRGHPLLSFFTASPSSGPRPRPSGFRPPSSESCGTPAGAFCWRLASGSSARPSGCSSATASTSRPRIDWVSSMPSLPARILRARRWQGRRRSPGFRRAPSSS